MVINSAFESCRKGAIQMYGDDDDDDDDDYHTRVSKR